MAVPKMKLLESRVATLEAELAKSAVTVSSLETEVAKLKESVNKAAADELPWWEERWGLFANDPDYDAAMELGRKYRESLRPKVAANGAKKRGKKSVKAGKRRNVHS
jgi:peptidoglycan hydrolase CwlO-like protein